MFVFLLFYELMMWLPILNTQDKQPGMGSEWRYL